MSIEELQSLVKSIAERADAAVVAVHSNHFLTALKNCQNVTDPMPDLSDFDRASIRKIHNDARAEIEAVFFSCGDFPKVAHLAAVYVLRETELQRLATARADGLEVKRQEARRFRERLQDERHKSKFYLEQSKKSNSIARSRLAKSGAKKRHEPTNLAKDFVVSEWSKHRLEYDNNKSAFARSYAARVRNEFTDANGYPLDIKEKTIREIWLCTPLSAGK